MNNQLPAVSMDVQHHATLGEPMAAEPFSPYKRIHRMLRGRYRYALPVMLLVAAAAAAYGYRTQDRIYRSVGSIDVAPTLPQVITETDTNEPLQMYAEYLQSQVLLLDSRPVIALALADPDLKAAFDGRKPPSIDAFGAGLTVEHPVDTESLQITYKSTNPVIAAASVKAVISAYLATYGQNDDETQQRRLQVLSDKKRDLSQQITQTIAQMEAAAVVPTANTIAVSDELMKTYLSQQTELELQLNALVGSGYGDNRPAVIAVRIQLDQLKLKIEEYRKDYARMQLSNAELPAASRVGNAFPELQGYEQTLDDLRQELIETNHRLDVLKTEARLHAERMNVASWGDVPLQYYSDHRNSAAMIWAVGAAMVTFLVFLCLGAIDQRYRFSDDANEAISSVPLLGVVPELPERMLYPDMASIAARCVHNLRVRLQLLGRSREHKLFMVTSATAGEGKTSLTLALGYSFASSGTRTLLIDCDMVGRGLTHRLKSADEPGLAESLEQPGLQNVKASAKNLWLLPVGQADEFGATSLSPEKLRELIDIACDAYDIVLVDTGPVLSSLEAPLVAQMSDHVILTIAQGQQQQCVQRAMRLLRMIGAPVAGFVFNRATANDYHRSVGGASNAYYRTHSRISQDTPVDVATTFGTAARSSLFMPSTNGKH
jgi:Mrp family chromosome partitioning ATPase